MQDTLIKMLIFFAVSSFFGWILFFTGISLARSKRRRDEREYSRTTGTIVDFEDLEIRSGRYPTHISLPVIEFTSYGRKYRVRNSNNLDEDKYLLGATVDVLYDPNDPTHFHLEADASYTNGGRNARKIAMIWILLAAVLTIALGVLVGGYRVDFRHLWYRIRNPQAKTVVEQTGTSQDFQYRVQSDSTAVILKYNGDDTSLVIPFQLDGHLVTGFSGTGFVLAVTLEELTIPGTIQTIPMGEFIMCARLRILTLRDGVRTIGSKAFQKCISLEKVTLPASLTSIEDDAFPDACTAQFLVAKDSPAERWCLKKGYTVEYSE